MKKFKNYDDYFARLNALKEETIETKHTSTEEECKDDKAYASAFWDAMHTGMPQNALKKGSDGSGGYLVPDTFEDKLVQSLTKKNLLRQLGTVIKINRLMKLPCVKAEGSAEWIPECEPVHFSDTTFGEIVFEAHKLAHRILISDELLEDSGFDMEEYILKRFEESFAKAEEDAFFTGDGNGKPLGIIHQAEVGKVVDNAKEIDFDDIIDLIYSVKESYRKNGVLIVSEDTALVLKKLHLYHGYPAWIPSLKKDVPDTLLEYPVYVSNNLPSLKSGNKPILFGDFSHYWIGECGKCSIKRLLERYADHGQVGYIGYERIDANLVLPEAVKALVIK